MIDPRRDQYNNVDHNHQLQCMHLVEFDGYPATMPRTYCHKNNEASTKLQDPIQHILEIVGFVCE